MLQRIQDFFRQKKWQQMKKSDWVAIALTGVLVLIVAIPIEKSEEQKQSVDEKNTGYSETASAVEKGADTGGDGYAAELETRLENILSQMEGVGKVDVMITLSDTGESVVEKDREDSYSSVTETDSDGGNRATTEHEESYKTVYVENGSETYPYIEKEGLPSIKGVVIVAEGGENPTVVSEISDAVMALFPVEAHRIKVVKMSSKEELR